MPDQTELLELLHSTPVSDVDLSALVERGTRRGRASLRRRRVVASLSTAAMVGVVGVGATVVPSWLASPAAAPITVVPAAPAAANPDTPREPIDPSQMAATLASLLPGESTDPANWHGQGFQAASVLLDGRRVDVLVEQTWSDVDQAKAKELGDELDSAEALCRRASSGGACTRVAAGWLRTHQYAETEQDHQNGIVGNHATLWTSDGWTVIVSAYNASGEKHTDPVSGDPVLTQGQVGDLAVSDAWFR